MNSFYNNRPNGYQESIQKGLSAVRSFHSGLSYGTGSREENIQRLKSEIETADAIVIGAGAGLSTAAGLTYSGERFDQYFSDFKERFGITDIRFRMMRLAGHGGRGIFTTIATLKRQSPFIRNYLSVFAVRITLSSPPMWIISSSKRGLIKSDYSIHRATMAFFRV